jgi:hypothetical protein
MLRVRRRRGSSGPVLRGRLIYHSLGISGIVVTLFQLVGCGICVHRMHRFRVYPTYWVISHLGRSSCTKLQVPGCSLMGSIVVHFLSDRLSLLLSLKWDVSCSGSVRVWERMIRQPSTVSTPRWRSMKVKAVSVQRRSAWREHRLSAPLGNGASQSRDGREYRITPRGNEASLSPPPMAIWGPWFPWWDAAERWSGVSYHSTGQWGITFASSHGHMRPMISLRLRPMPFVEIRCQE